MSSSARRLAAPILFFIVLTAVACSGSSGSSDGGDGGHDSGAAGATADGAAGAPADGGPDAAGTPGEDGGASVDANVGSDGVVDAGPADGAMDAIDAGSADGATDAVGADATDAATDTVDVREAGAEPAVFALSFDDTAPSVELRATRKVTVSIAANGYVGAVSLRAAGLPAFVTAAFSSSTVTLAGTGSATSTLSLTTTSDAATGKYPFQVFGGVPSGEQAQAAALTIEPTITFTIPAGTGSTFTTDVLDLFGANPTIIKATADLVKTPISVRFYNADSVYHTIHIDAPAGVAPLSHGVPPGITPGTFDAIVRLATQVGSYKFYLHDSGHHVQGAFKIQP
jgi:hypothetical protein